MFLFLFKFVAFLLTTEPRGGGLKALVALKKDFFAASLLSLFTTLSMMYIFQTTLVFPYWAGNHVGFPEIPKCSLRYLCIYRHFVQGDQLHTGQHKTSSLTIQILNFLILNFEWAKDLSGISESRWNPQLQLLYILAFMSKINGF